MTPAQSTAASELLLKALKERQAAVIHSNLADDVRSSIDVATIQKRLDSRKTILSTKVIGVTTADGEKAILPCWMTTANCWPGNEPVRSTVWKRRHLIS